MARAVESEIIIVFLGLRRIGFVSDTVRLEMMSVPAVAVPITSAYLSGVQRADLLLPLAMTRILLVIEH